MPRPSFVIAVVTTLAAAPSSPRQTPDLALYLMTDRAAEIALARSAGAKHVSDSATVLVLTRGGLIEAARGTNGFTCFVQRSFYGGVGDPGFWDPRIRAPICLNPPAVRTMLPEMRKRAEWIMTGVSPTEIAARTRRAYEAHEFPLPAPGAMGFMLSPEQHLANDDPHWVPHLMLFYDRSTPAAAWGVGGVANTVIDGTPVDRNPAVLTLLIPVRRWSDGRLVAPDDGKQHE